MKGNRWLIAIALCVLFATMFVACAAPTAPPPQVVKETVVVQQTVKATTTAGPRAAIQQAVADGQLTQDNADWLLLGLEKDYWGAGRLWSVSPQLRVGPSLNVSHWRQPGFLLAQH